MQESQVTPVAGQRRAAARRPAFTLTELLIVIAIIAVLAGLIAAAAVNALRRGREARIALELKNMSGAIENFKNDPNIGGAYPCSAAYATNPTNAQKQQARSDLQRAFAKMFPRANEPSLALIINKLAGDTAAPGTMNFGGHLEGGLSPSEALFFWMGGFSSDQTLPLSGAGGPAFIGTEILENRKPGYEFDYSRLGPRDDNGNFVGRYIEYPDPVNPGDTRRINLWTYTPAGSQVPYAYFDVSRIKPSTCSTKFGPPANNVASLPWARSNPLDANSVLITPLREPLESAPNTNGTIFAETKFVNQDKFQILHPGLDDAWGAGFDVLMYPSGPYIGEIADTLTNFTDSTLENASEQ
ncbi:type II secretion system protein [Lacipirellula sp.]|uniref:type II secretion system protein n=1 Tax=Lacipirellula sp. TaxID=2691419 RepID=UPI003D11589E